MITLKRLCRVAQVIVGFFSGMSSILSNKVVQRCLCDSWSRWQRPSAELRWSVSGFYLCLFKSHVYLCCRTSLVYLCYVYLCCHMSTCIVISHLFTCVIRSRISITVIMRHRSTSVVATLGRYVLSQFTLQSYTTSSLQTITSSEGLPEWAEVPIRS